MSVSFLSRVAWLAVLGPGLAVAQEPGSAAWTQVQQSPTKWPAQVKLKKDEQLVILRDGQQVGAIGAPADSLVQLVSVEATTLRIAVGAAQASVAPDDTDFAERLAAAGAGAAPPSTSAVAVVTNTPATNAPPVVAPPAPVAAAPNEASLPAVSGAPLQFDFEAPPGSAYKKAAFHFWSPAYAQPLRGLIIMTPGNNGDGRGMTKDPAWEALARKHGLGLIASCLQGGDYQRPELGTGDAFRAARSQFANQSGHPEVATVPLLLWGVSAGGQWNYNYMLWRPDDVMAFVVNKGGYYEDGDPDSHARQTPGLFILGQADQAFRIQAITKIWTAGRSAGALWALAPQPRSGHEFSKTDPLARVFFEAVLQARLPDSSALSADSTDGPALKPMQENPGWLGNLTTHEVHDDSTDADMDRKAAWLPDQATAQAWKVFVSGG
jgi:hypothetical protein